MSTRSVPVLELTGGPKERGHAHGEALREQIAVRIERVREDLAQAWRSDRAGVDRELPDLLGDTGFVAAMDRWAPGLTAEIDAIADGAAIPRLDALLLNLPDEMAWLRGPLTGGGSCSALAICRPDGGWLAGQTMDLDDSYAGSEAILRLVQPHGDTLVLTTAGVVGLCGVSAAGVAVFVNQLMQLRKSRNGLPVAAVVRAALASPSFSEARRLLYEVEHASGQNYLLAGREEAVNVECSAAGAIATPTSTALWHTNHPLTSTDVEPGAQYSGFAGNSHERFDFLAAQVPASRSRADLATILADRNVPVCKVPGPDGRQLSFGAVLADLGAPATRAWIAPGPPDRTDWIEFELASAPD